jgi:hypothetical protein
MAQTIPVGSDRFAIVDDEDYEPLNKYAWSLHVGRYAIMRGNWGNTSVLMHHNVVGKPGRGFVVDHINGNGLDNRRCNLRIVSHGENLRNQKKPSKNNKLGQKLITQRKDCGLGYRVYWRERGDKKQRRKRFSRLEDAIKFRDEILKKHYQF